MIKPFPCFLKCSELFPYDGACEDITVDKGLSFLDDFVSTSLAAGARPYLPPDRRSFSILTSDNMTPSSSVSPSPAYLITTSVAPINRIQQRLPLT